MAPPNQQNPLALLLELQGKTRELSSLDELFFFIVNEAHSLVPYRQAVLLDAMGKVVGLSGVANIVGNAPFVQWVEKTVSVDSVEKDQIVQGVSTDLFEGAQEWLDAYVILFPLKTRQNVRFGTLLLTRDEPWNEAETSFVSHLMDACAFAWSAFTPKPKKSLIERIPRKWKLGAAACGVAMLFFPVHLSVLAQGEIIAKDAVVIRAPMSGIIDEILVKPNQTVAENQSLLQMDVTEYENEKRVAQKKVQGLRSQYRQQTRQALIDPKVKAELVVLAARIKEQQVELTRLNGLIERAHMTSTTPATVILDDGEDWAGKPVQVGEKILSLADEEKVEVEAWLPVGDAIDLPKESRLKLFLNADPLNPIDAVIERISFKAVELPSGIMAHRVLAQIVDGQEYARLGAQGTARIEGERVSLFYWVFRRPIAVIRQFIGI